MTRWLITGGHGQLGSDAQLLLAAEPANVVHAAGSDALDITDRESVARVVTEFAPDVIVNAAAYNAVDLAESDEERAYRVNATGPAILATEAERAGARLVHVSTDYVFAGDGTRPYEVDDPPAPNSAYGRTKRAGEQAVRELMPDDSYVVRTAWVYGASSAGSANFVKTMAKLERECSTVSVVNDQRGSPTWSADLARGLIELARSAAPGGIYHCTGTGDTTWFGFAQAIFAELGADPSRVLPVTTDAFPRPAPRPAYSVLSDRAWRAAGLTPMPDWREALRTAFTEQGPALRGTPHPDNAAR